MERRALVLLPGMDGTGELFAPFVAALGDDFEVRVVRYPTDQALGYKELEALVREQLPKQANFVLLAESFSGPIAISIAASPPPNLIGLVLCNTFARNPRPELAAFAPLVGLLPLKLPPVAVLGHYLLGPFSTPALLSTLSTALAQVSTAVLRARIKALLKVDVTAKLPAIRVPLLYLLADQDKVVPKAAADLILEAIPSAKVVSYAAPHFLLQAAPSAAAAAEVVSAFLLLDRF